MSDPSAEDVERMRAELASLRAQVERRRRSPATVIALVACIIAVSGGTALAAATVGTADIKRGAVTTPKLANAAAETNKIAGGAVTGSKLRKGAVSSGKIGTGQVRAPNLGTITERYSGLAAPPLATSTVTATCEVGERVVGGGHMTDGGNVVNLESRRFQNGWRAQFQNNENVTTHVYAQALCLVG
jgi:hypothetical protein